MVAPYLGEIRMFGGSYAPRGWTFCAGTLLGVTGNEALFSLLSNNFGGDGRTNFALPDLRGRIPIHQGQGNGLTPRYLGEQFGVEKVALELTQMPSHSHPIQASTNDATHASPLGAVLAKGSDGGTTAPTDNIYVAKDGLDNLTAFADEAVSEVGQGNGHYNLMPFLAVQFIIAILGTFPPRN